MAFKDRTKKRAKVYSAGCKIKVCQTEGGRRRERMERGRERKERSEKT